MDAHDSPVAMIHDANRFHCDGSATQKDKPAGKHGNGVGCERSQKDEPMIRHGVPPLVVPVVTPLLLRL